MKTKFIILLILAMLVALVTFSQDQKKKGLFVGDTIADVSMETIINSNMPKAKLSDFKGKLILLDFWTITCGGCISAFPKLEVLQKEFGDKIVILPVSFAHKKNEVEQFLRKKEKYGEPIGLPIPVYETMDNELLQMFPIVAFPLVIWIDGNSKVVGITDSFVVTKENIQAILNHQNIDLPVSGMYERINGRKSKTVRDSVSGKDGSLLFKAEIKPYSKNSGVNKFSVEQSDAYTRITYTNTSIVNLAKASVYHQDNVDFFNQYLKVSIADSSRFFLPKKENEYYEKMGKNAFSYELILPARFSLEEAFAIMNRQVSEYFGIKFDLQKLPVKCLALQRVGVKDRLKSKGGLQEVHNNKELTNRTFLTFNNQPVSTLVAYLVNGNFPPIIDETSYKANVDIEINFAKNNLESLNENLKNYGLILKTVERFKEVLVVRDK